MRKKTKMKVSLPTLGDLGTCALGAVQNTIIEPRGYINPKTGMMRNPNGIKGRRRIDFIEKYEKSGVISYDQYSTAKSLRDAYLLQFKSPSANPVRVDTTLNPGLSTEIIVSRIGTYHKIALHIPQRSRGIITRVVLDNLPISEGSNRGRRSMREKEMLREGLDHIRSAMSRVVKG